MLFGYCLGEYQTPFLGQVRKGIENVHPCHADGRRALLLPYHIQNDAFSRSPRNSEATLSACATVLGFVGMLRPHTFSQLKVSSFLLIERKSGPIPGVDTARYLKHRGGSDLLEFLITFKSKTMPVARAYFPNLSKP